MREISNNTIGKRSDQNPSDQKLLDKKRRERKIGEQLSFLEHDDSSTSSYSEIK